MALHPIGGLLYNVYRTQEFDIARQAFHVEQEVLKAFDAQRHSSNREVLRGPSPAQIEAVWDAQVTAAMLGHRVHGTPIPMPAIG